LEKRPVLLKIAIVLNSSWQAYNFRLNLAKSLKVHGHEVFFVSPYDEKYSALIGRSFKHFNINIDSKGINPINDIRLIFSLSRLYKLEKPDIVLNFTIKPNIYSSIVSGLMGIKSISNITGLGTTFIKQSLVTKIVKLLYKNSLRFNNKVFFQNIDDKKLFIENKLVRKEKVSLLPGSGVDLDKFTPIKKNRVVDKFRFLLIARLLKDKGIIEFNEAAKIIKGRYSSVSFEILGELGALNRTAIGQIELQSWIDSGLVEYLGISDNVEDIIACSDCVVLPSYREGIPRSLLEACAMEKPIIATNVVGCKDVVDEGVNGYLCKVKDAKDLSDKMEIMINLSEEEREKMGKSGRIKMIEKFDEKIVIQKYLNVISELID